MRNYTSGLVPIFTLIGATVIASPESASGQEMVATLPLVGANTELSVSTVGFGSSAEWRAYAIQLVNEAGDLPAGSAETLQMIHTAASIRLNLGEGGVALDLIVKAADAAEGAGAVALAAHAYLDAAWIASAIKRPSQVNQLAERAIMLTISPLMSEGDRLAVLRRVQRSTHTEMAAR